MELLESFLWKNIRSLLLQFDICSQRDLWTKGAVVPSQDTMKTTVLLAPEPFPTICQSVALRHFDLLTLRHQTTAFEDTILA